MFSKLYSPSKRSDGFTLIELLVVIVIIAVLAAIALPIFINQSRIAVDASVKSDVRNSVTNVNEFRATHDTELPASAEAYAADGGVLATSKNAYVNVSFDGDGSYTVCGYNPDGAKYTSHDKAWVFTSSNGKFFNFADLSGDCINAVHWDGPVEDPTTTPTPTGQENTTRDPDGVYTDPTDPIDPAGGGDGNDDPTPATCPAPDDSKVTLTKPETRLSNATALYLGSARLSGDHDRVANAQQARDMKTVSDWVANYAASHVNDTVNDRYVDAMANEAYFGSSSIGVFFYNIDEEVGSNAAAHVNVVDYNDGYSWQMGIGSNPTEFLSEWDNDQNPNEVDVTNHHVTSRPAILNTSGHQTEGYLHIVSGGSGWKEYVPECGSEQEFSGSDEVTPTDPPNECMADAYCGTDPGPSDDPSDPLTVTSSGWQYAFDGPTAADEVAGKGDYPGMCYFDPDDPAQSAQFPLGNELCVDNTGDGTDNPAYGTQLIRTAELTGDDFPSSDNTLHVDGDLDFINGDYQCSANDGVHYIDKGNIFTQQFLPYGRFNNAPRVGNSATLEVEDYWTMSVYVQCDTTAKIARIAVLITYPENVARTFYGNDSFNSIGGAYFRYDGPQYQIIMSGETSRAHAAQTHWNKDDIFDRDNRAPYFYPTGWHGQTIYPH